MTATSARVSKRNKLAVKVAKDLLKNMRYYKHIRGGDYCAPEYAVKLSENTPQEVRKKCHVCAMGALFVEAMHINGAVFPNGEEKIKAVVDAHMFGYPSIKIIAALRPAFTEGRLRDIEAAFEHGEHSAGYSFLLTPTNWRGEDGSRERLRDILKWIIKHEGEFPQRTED